ncbi:hypothetical protein CesoFtcFv8_025088 [Champsocephalus esox]|uniref:DH domain-containing protein n=1 Tax=Champsocephalus esox TaxID=159716 RepID=A0AAN8GG16_9TELE|nr:hypothetical protein CesoFtcFv8_025088 [Champsocephalus esox]
MTEESPEKQLRLRVCVLSELLHTERDYVQTLEFLSVSTRSSKNPARLFSMQTACGCSNKWQHFLPCWSVWGGGIDPSGGRGDIVKAGMCELQPEQCNPHGVGSERKTRDDNAHNKPLNPMKSVPV